MKCSKHGMKCTYLGMSCIICMMIGILNALSLRTLWAFTGNRRPTWDKESRQNDVICYILK